MTLTSKTATIFGGTGFVGTQIVRELATRGYRIKVATRVPERVLPLKPCGTVGQIVGIQCHYNEEDIRKIIRGSDIVINCIGILYQRSKNGFNHAHVEIPEYIAKACKKENVKRFVHISALGIEDSKAKYAISKVKGENAVKKHFPDVTILRPSVIFGEEDQFFNTFASLIKFTPALPLIGGGKTKFQPVYVGDVADAVMTTLEREETKGRVYCLGGPEIVTLKEIYQKLFKHTNTIRALISVPFCLAKLQAIFFSLLPKPLLTCDQVELLKTDNIVKGGMSIMQDLRIQPATMDIILPKYLRQYRPGGKFGEEFV